MASTNAPNLSSLHDIVGPIRIIPLWQWLTAALVALLLLGLLLGAGYWWWRSRQRRQEVPQAPPLPAHIRARHLLEQALRWLSDPDRFCTEVSRILRDYLEERFGWNAPDRTTEEFLVELRNHAELSPGHRELLAHFLTRCDLVKFARHDPTETELRELHGAAVRLVEDTVPPPPPVGGARPASLVPTSA